MWERSVSILNPVEALKKEQEPTTKLPTACGGLIMVIEKDEMDKHKSPYGNRYREITVEDLLAIFHGKVLCLNDGEYTTFIYLEQPAEVNDG